jgi:threonine/homoserine/homoserine lactone efflux protein
VALEAWLALTGAIVLGAVSPGPSLAVVLRNTLAGGRRQGVLTGLGHGVGFGIYAFFAAVGLASLLALHPATQGLLRWGGAALLAYLGYSFLKHAMAGPQPEAERDLHPPSSRQGFLQGLLIAVLNPKILAWMLAIFAPFIDASAGAPLLLGIAALGMLIDGAWYITVATVLSSGDRVERLRRVAHRIDAALGLLMLCFAALLIAGVV